MLDSVAKLLGSGFVLPTLALLALAWAMKFLFDLHVSTRQSRKDFLDVWRGIDRNDDVLLETTVRHLWGTYLPANVIRMLIASPFPTEALRHAVAVWDHVRYDPHTGWVQLQPAWLARPGLRKLAKWGLLLAYIAFASSALLLSSEMAGLSPTQPRAWLLLILIATCAILAIASLARSSSMQTLDRHALGLITLINEAARRAASAESHTVPATAGTRPESEPPTPAGRPRRRRSR